MRILAYFLLGLVFVFSFVACGGGGGGVATVPGTTPLDENDPTSLSGTYRITQWEFYGPSGFYFDSTQLAFFSGIYVINYAQNYVEYKMEWHDSVYGDYYDYDRVYLDEPIDDVEVEEIFYQINTDYQITIFAKNMYVPGLGYFDQVVRLTKTSDSTAPIPLKRDIKITPDNPMLPIKPGLIVHVLQR